MTVFGLFRAAGLPGVIGDPRLWIAVTCVALLTVAFGLAAPHQVRRRADRRHEALRRAVFTVTTPVMALPLAVGITDPPVLALFCVALACLGAGPAARGPAPRAAGLRWLVSPHRIRPSRSTVAALAIGIACAMKITAWPALPVIAVMIAARDGRRAAWRFAATSAVTACTAIAAAAPAALAKPSVFLHNIVLYPLGLTRHLTPAASPLPGHLLAATGTAGRWAAICLLLVAGLAVAAWILTRRPADDRAVAWRLAAGLCVMFILAPATRWGYFAYPLGLLGWLSLTGRDRAVADRLSAAASLAWLAPCRGQADVGHGRASGVAGNERHSNGPRALGSDQGDGVPALAALTGPARTARAAGRGPRPGALPHLRPLAGPEAGRGIQTQPGAGSRRPRPQPAPHPAGARNQEAPTALTDPWSGEDDDTGCDDDTDYDYYDTPSGNIWRPGAEPRQPSGGEPGRPGRSASLSFPDRPYVASPAERGPVRPDKETA
jgi:hypothetical protein